MRIPKRITFQSLRRRGACFSQHRLFERTFPKGAALTLENCKKARTARLDLIWLAEEFFDSPKYDELWTRWANRRIGSVELFMSCYRLSQKKK